MYPDCIVIGASLMGMFAANTMAEAGMSVTIIDSSDPTTILSDVQGEVLLFGKRKCKHGEALRNNSLKWCQQFIDKAETLIDLQNASEIKLVTREQLIDAAKKESETLRNEGYPIEYIEGRNLGKVEPGLKGELFGGTLQNDIKSVSSAQLYESIMHKCENNKNIELLWDTPGYGIDIHNEQVTAVRSIKGDIYAKQVLVAAGLETLGIVSSVGVQIPVIPQRRYQLVGQPFKTKNYRIIKEFNSSDPAMTVINNNKKHMELDMSLCLCLFENQPILVGEGKEIVTIEKISEEQVKKEIENYFHDIMPGFNKLIVEKVKSRLDLVIYDAMPIIGLASDIEGLYLGLYQRDETDMMAPGLGDLAARIIMSEAISDEEKRLSPERFPRTAPGGMKRIVE